MCVGGQFLPPLWRNPLRGIGFIPGLLGGGLALMTSLSKPSSNGTGGVSWVL